MNMGRISMPSIPLSSSRPFPRHSIEIAAERLARFLQDAKGNALLITGAGISVDSGIRAYRGTEGVCFLYGRSSRQSSIHRQSYTVHTTYRPIFHHERVLRLLEASFGTHPKNRFVASYAARQRYWARSYMGYPPVRV
jgi:NAD-dependent deacetylase sirtuin 4